MANARKVHSYIYVQGTTSAPSLYDDDDDYRDDEDEDYEDFDAEEPLPPSSGHSPSGGSKTLQYAMASSSSQPPDIPTFDTITEAVNKLQNRYSSTSSSIPNAAPSQPIVRETTPPYDRPPSSSSSTSNYTVATDYAAPIKISREISTTRPPSTSSSAPRSRRSSPPWPSSCTTAANHCLKMDRELNVGDMEIGT